MENGVGGRMKIITWNVNGIRSVLKKGFYDFIKKENPDILCLQEIKFSETVKVSGYYSYYNPSDRRGYSGVCILSKEKALNVRNKIGIREFDLDGRFLMLEFKHFVIINLYMPHGRRDKSKLNYKLISYEKLMGFLKGIKKEIILLGDFNIAHNEIDLANPRQNKKNIMFSQEERQAIQKLLDFGFIDSFRFLNKDTKKFSWWPYYNNLRKRNIGWRIDYIFISRNLSKQLIKSDLLNEVYGSDHCPAIIELKIK